jgi:hypothetical protein
MLPSDRYLADLLGLTDEEFDYWRDESRKRVAEGPQPAVVMGEPLSTAAIVSLVLTALSIGFQIISFLLAPKPGTPASIKARNRDGNSQTNLQAFAPRVGFDAVQQVASLGDPIPVVYANRETIDGVTYGGVRVNASLLWSQIQSLGGSQMLRAVFMLSEGRLASIDPNGFAIGDNSISIYDLGTNAANEIGSRITIYYRPDGGRIAGADRILGRSASTDPGNAINDGAADVFQVKSIGNDWAPDFSAAFKPTTSTTFGVYSPIGNNLGFKLMPSVRPGVTARLKPKGDEGDAIVTCDLDYTAQVQRKKFRAFFSSRSGITGGTFGTIGDLVTYKLLPSSDFETVFQEVPPEGDDWTASVELRDYDRFFYPDEIFPGTVYFGIAGLVSLGDPTVDTEAKTVSVVATVDKSDCEDLYDFAAAGEYRIRYLITLENETRGTEAQLKFNVFVRVNGAGLVSLSFGPEDIGLDEESENLGPASGSGDLQARVIYDYTEDDIYEETADDASSSIATRQKAWDDAIVVGDLYKIGSAIAVCTGRTPADEIFRSDVELEDAGSGQAIEASFRIVRPGAAATISEEALEEDGLTESPVRQTATSGPHIMRLAMAHGTTTRECRIVELGIRSTMGIRLNGILRFRGTKTFAEADGRACLNKEGDLIRKGRTVKVDQYQSGQLIGSAERYSFQRVSYKKQSESVFTPLSQVFGFVGIEQQAMFNYLRLEFPADDSWEWMIEPLTGWEIRNVVTNANLYVIDSRMSTLQEVTTATGGRTVKAIFNGRIVPRETDVFNLRETEREDIGLPHVDVAGSYTNYADAWGKLAEFFVYEEIQTSTDGPEHEIVYVNEIVQNAIAPLYSGIALLGVNAVSAFEWRQFTQLSGYATGGDVVRRLLNGLSEGPSHLLPDLALDRLTNSKYGSGISDDLIGFATFESSAQWCYDRRYFFDGGVIISQSAPRQWIADTAAAMLLDYREVNGRYELVPAISFVPVTHKALFTAGNIAEGSFKFETIPPEDRLAVQASVKWRQERSSTNPGNPGLFPEEREVLVREAAPFGSDDMPIESIDLSDFCTNENHAIDVAKFTLRMRRFRDHSISFTTTYDGLEGISTGVGPGDLIRVAMDTTAYDELNNGAVLSDGTVVSTTTLTDGTYSVVSWGGTGAINDNAELTISGGSGSPASIMFTVKTTQVKSYQITKITPSENGVYNIEAVHMPTNAAGIMLVAADWDTDGAWVIQR